jgi:hypothetical protein
MPASKSWRACVVASRHSSWICSEETALDRDIDLRHHQRRRCTFFREAINRESVFEPT